VRPPCKPAGPFYVGRARSADFVIPDSLVSRQHLLIEQVGSVWRVRDISSNGTWIDGKPMQSVEVHGEVRLRLGAVTGPEVLVLSEPAGGGYDDPDFDMKTMLRDSTGYQRERSAPGGCGPPGAANGGVPGPA
jgi:hypothetical protein